MTYWLVCWFLYETNTARLCYNILSLHDSSVSINNKGRADLHDTTFCWAISSHIFSIWEQPWRYTIWKSQSILCSVLKHITNYNWSLVDGLWYALQFSRLTIKSNQRFHIFDPNNRELSTPPLYPLSQYTRPYYSGARLYYSTWTAAHLPAAFVLTSKEVLYLY